MRDLASSEKTDQTWRNLGGDVGRLLGRDGPTATSPSPASKSVFRMEGPFRYSGAADSWFNDSRGCWRTQQGM